MMGYFFFTTASRQALGTTTQPPIHWVPGAFTLGIKRPVREGDHSPQSSAEVKDAWSIPPLPQYVLMAWSLIKHGDNFAFTLNSKPECAKFFHCRFNVMVSACDRHTADCRRLASDLSHLTEWVSRVINNIMTGATKCPRDSTSDLLVWNHKWIR
jgi:hypothetical protein